MRHEKQYSPSRSGRLASLSAGWSGQSSGQYRAHSRLRKEADARGEATVTVPTGLLGMVVHCALNGGYRAGEHRSRTPLSSTDKEIRQAAEDGAPELFA